MLFKKQSPDAPTMPTPTEHERKEQRLQKLKEEYDQYTDQFYSVGIKGELVELSGRKRVYYITETENEYVLYPDIIGRGCTVYVPEAYEEALALPTISLSKSDYQITFPKDNLVVAPSNEFHSKYSLSVIHVNFVSAEHTYTINLPDSAACAKLFGNAPSPTVYGELESILTMPQDTMVVKMSKTKVLANESPDNYFVWRKDDTLCFAKYIRQTTWGSNPGKVIGISAVAIPVSQIKYYKEIGTLRYEQIISGGGGGGTTGSFGGALLGGLLFGGVGAIIGSNLENEIKIGAITSETKEIDTRLLCLVFTGKDGAEYTVAFDNDSTPAFEWFIPEKEYGYVIQKRRDAYEQK